MAAADEPASLAPPASTRAIMASGSKPSHQALKRIMNGM